MKKSPSVLYFLTIMALDLKNSLLYFDFFIDTPKSKEALSYVSNMGYIFVVDKLLKEFPSLSSEIILKLKTINTLILALDKISDKCEMSKNNMTLRDQAKKCLSFMYGECLQMMVTEMDLNKLREIKESSLNDYIRFILDFEENESTLEIVPFFRSLLIKEIL